MDDGVLCASSSPYVLLFAANLYFTVSIPHTQQSAYPLISRICKNSSPIPLFVRTPAAKARRVRVHRTRTSGPTTPLSSHSLFTSPPARKRRDDPYTTYTHFPPLRANPCSQGPSCASTADPYQRADLQQTGPLPLIKCPIQGVDAFTYCVYGSNTLGHAGVCR